MCSAPVLNSRGEMIAIQGTTRDITAQRLLVEELRSSVELFSIFFHSNKSPCCMTDITTGAIVYANSAWLSNFDCSLDEIVGSTLANLGIFGDSGQVELTEVIEKVKANSNPIQSKINLLTKTGEEQVCSVTSFSVDVSGIQRVFTSIVDNTDNERIESELLKVAKLESANTLVGGIAHELSNSLAGVIGNLNLARSATSQSACDEYLDKTEAAASWLSDLTQKLVEFSSIQGSKLEYTDMGNLLRKSVSLSLHESEVSHKIEIAPDLWHVIMNPGQISQVVNNLVINAQQAMPNGGKITVTAQNVYSELLVNSGLKLGRYVKVSIADQGEGLPKEIEGKVFEAFATTKVDSSGLGLASSKSIVEMHKGHIDVASSLDGTTEPARRGLQPLPLSALHRLERSTHSCAGAP